MHRRLAPAPATREGGQHLLRNAVLLHGVCGRLHPGQAPASDRPADATSHDMPPANHNRMAGKADAQLSVHSVMQQRCHHASASARSPSSPPMSRPLLHQTATARQEKFQLPIAEQNFFLSRMGGGGGGFIRIQQYYRGTRGACD